MPHHCLWIQQLVLITSITFSFILARGMALRSLWSTGSLSSLLIVLLNSASISRLISRLSLALCSSCMSCVEYHYPKIVHRFLHVWIVLSGLKRNEEYMYALTYTRFLQHNETGGFPNRKYYYTMERQTRQNPDVTSSCFTHALRSICVNVFANVRWNVSVNI